MAAIGGYLSTNLIAALVRSDCGRIWTCILSLTRASCSGEMARTSPMASASPGTIFDLPDTVALATRLRFNGDAADNHTDAVSEVWLAQVLTELI